MNAIFLTQSKSLRMFYDLAQALREPLQLDRVGFYVAYFPYFRQFTQETPDLVSGNYYLLKEWEITSRARNGKPNLDLIRRYEWRLGNPNLWGALLADRRIYMGRKATFVQDYRPRFNHDEMLNILQAGLVSVEQCFDQVQPDFVVSFVCVTLGEYLAYLFARARGIPFLNLRTTRIQNYVNYAPDIFEPSKRIWTTYKRYLTEEIADRWEEQAREYIAFAQAEHPLYEGVIASARSPRRRRLSMPQLCGQLVKLLQEEYDYRFREVKDNHDPGVLVPLLYRRFLNPLQGWQTRRRLSAGYLTERDLTSMNYVFFPLHTEPEVSLLVYSRSFLNQIEVVRNLSLSLPVGMTLVVKDHPAAVNKRPLSYYQKLLDIPNVRLADPTLSSKPLVANARLVATIGSSVGFEAVLQQKPVVVLGHALYEFLPTSMVRRVADLERLGDEIDDLLQHYEYQEKAVTAYVAAIMSESVPVNLYSTLLGRQDVHSLGDERESEEAWQQDIQALAQYTVDSLVAFGAQMPTAYQ